MGSEHPEQVKAAVMAALLAGQSLAEVSREYKVPKSTVCRWKKEGVPLDGPQKKDVGILLLDYLETNLETLRTQAEVFRDRDWLLKQSASEVAVLHGVMTDKAVRLLEALSKNAPDDRSAAN
jgi:transposase-like protein